VPAAVFVAVLATVVAIGESWAVLTDPWRIVDDVRQHVFWTYRYRDAALFAGDLYADFFSALAPLGYHALFWLIARVGDPLTASRWLPLALTAVTLVYAWRLGRALELRWGGFLATLLLLPYLHMFRGGLPRSFAFALLVPHLYFVVTGRHGRAAVMLILQALIYPQSFLIGVGVQTLAVLRSGWPRPAWRPLVMLLIGVAVAGLTLAPRYAGARPATVGPLITRSEARAAPEFQPGGRAAFFDPDPVRFYLTGKRSGLGWNSRLTQLAVLVALVALVRGGAIRRTAAVIPDLAVVSLALFAAAHALLFRLHLPNRYVQWTLPLAAALFVAAHARLAAERLRDWLPALARAWPILGRARWGVALVLLAAVVIGTVAEARRHAARPPETAGLHLHLRTLPVDALVAGHSLVLAEIPVVDRRRILEDAEFALPYFRGYYHEVVRRTKAREAVWQSGSPEALGGFCRQFGVTHLLVDRRAGIPATLPLLRPTAQFDDGRFLLAPCPAT
jgi:hypothetical protein